MKVEPEVDLDYMGDGEDNLLPLTPNGTIENGFDPGKCCSIYTSFIYFVTFASYFYFSFLFFFLYFETQNIREKLSEIAESVRYATKCLVHPGTEKNMRGLFMVWWMVKILYLLKIQNTKVEY